MISIGLTTKPYPLFRMPGFHKYSIAYLSSGQRRYNQPFGATNYGPQVLQGDVVGVGYRPRTGAIFFTRNGKKLEEVVHGLKTQNFFPTIGANGPSNVHVNFGQMGFVFIEANVKKWGLAPMTGSLAPPPPYGSEAGSILLETGRDGLREGSGWLPGHGRTHSNQARLQGRPMRSPNGPDRSPTEISLANFNLLDYTEVAEDSHESDDAGEGRSITFSPPPRSSSQRYIEQSPSLNRGSGTQQQIMDRPPPDYESPKGSQADPGSDADDDDDSDTTPRASDQQPLLNRKDSPPIPSYEAATGTPVRR